MIIQNLLINLIIFFSFLHTDCTEAVEISPNQYCTFMEGTSTWFTFTTDEPILVNIITAGNEDGKMELYKGNCEDLEFIEFDDNDGPFLMPQINIETEEHTTYYVRVFDVELFEICVFNCGPLPVELVSYKIQTNDIFLKHSWSTASELNNNYFRIYKSKDLKSWELLGQIPGNNNANYVNYYSFNSSIIDNTIMYYKLTQTDFNGVETEISILPYLTEKQMKTLIKEITINGNPISKEYNGIRVKVYSNGTVEKVIYEK